jgi:hypothetical protein
MLPLFDLDSALQSAAEHPWQTFFLIILVLVFARYVGVPFTDWAVRMALRDEKIRQERIRKKNGLE